MVVGAQDLLVAPVFVPGADPAHHPPGAVALFPSAELLESPEDALATKGSVWISGVDTDELAEAARLATEAGVEPSTLVLECPSTTVPALVAAGHTVAVCPDDEGMEPGGSLEATVVAALAAGAVFVRTSHTDAARRAMDVTAALATEAALR